MTDIATVVNTYIATWNERDPGGAGPWSHKRSPRTPAMWTPTAQVRELRTSMP